MGRLTGYNQARISLGAGVAAMVLVLALLGTASLGLSCPGRPQPGPILDFAQQQSGLVLIVLGILMIVAALAAIVLGIGALRRKAEDPRISGRASVGTALGLVTIPCGGPLALVGAAFIGVATCPGLG